MWARVVSKGCGRKMHSRPGSQASICLGAAAPTASSTPAWPRPRAAPDLAGGSQLMQVPDHVLHPEPSGASDGPATSSPDGPPSPGFLTQPPFLRSRGFPCSEAEPALLRSKLGPWASPPGSPPSVECGMERRGSATTCANPGGRTRRPQQLSAPPRRPCPVGPTTGQLGPSLVCGVCARLLQACGHVHSHTQGLCTRVCHTVLSGRGGLLPAQEWCPAVLGVGGPWLAAAPASCRGWLLY